MATAGIWVVLPDRPCCGVRASLTDHTTCVVVLGRTEAAACPVPFLVCEKTNDLYCGQKTHCIREGVTPSKIDTMGDMPRTGAGHVVVLRSDIVRGLKGRSCVLRPREEAPTTPRCAILSVRPGRTGVFVAVESGGGGHLMPGESQRRSHGRTKGGVNGNCYDYCDDARPHQSHRY